jgi:hypothetical protein
VFQEEFLVNHIQNHSGDPASLGHALYSASFLSVLRYCRLTRAKASSASSKSGS